MANWNPPPGGGQPPGGYGPPPGGYGAPPPGAPYGSPPPGGYGAQPPANFGAPPMYPPTQFQPAVQGSIGLGFLAGFFGGCIGLILVQVIAKGPDTKKGAWMGFVAGIVVGMVFRVIAQVAN